MKHCTAVVLILLACSIFVSAQSPTHTKPAIGAVTKSDVTTVRKGSFPREKFDPLRDPGADLQAAIAKASTSGKRIILDVGGEWCGWCVYMDKFFLENPPLAKLRDDNYVWIKVNMSSENENSVFLSAYPTILGYPHLYVLDEKGALLHSQNTEELESGKGYDLKVFTGFLQKWAPVRP